MIELLKQVADRVTTPLVNFAGSHPVGTLFALVITGVAVLILNAIRYRYPEYATRPEWAKWVLLVTDPLTGNLWGLLTKLGLKRREDDPVGLGLKEDP